MEKLSLPRLWACTVLICLLAVFQSFAADLVDLRHETQIFTETGRAQVDLQTALGLTPEEGLNILRQYQDSTGLTHTRFQQTYLGIPVWGEHIVVSRTADKVQWLHGRTVTGIDGDLSNTQPNFSAQDALEHAKELHGKTGEIKDFVRGKREFENQESELVIFVTRLGVAKLAYAVSFFSDQPGGGDPTRPTYILDAHTQDILFQFEGLATADGTGPGGNNKTGQYEYGTDFPAFNVSYNSGTNTSTMNNTDVKTVNLNHGTSGSTAYSYSGTNNTFKSINGAFCPLNDAHFFGGVVFNMYNDWVGAAPLTFQLSMRVHYSSNYENAFWNGSSMTFGDGASTFYPLVSLDVSAHEVSHGFTEQNSDLIYSAQSGGINEAFSDMAGEAAENYMKGSNDWEVGADIFKASGALRYMNNPPLDGRSIDSANDYTSGMDVHFSSGVFNKAFYLLATTAGWDTRKAFEVFAKANQNYWTPSTNFIAGAEGARDAASDLGYSTTDVETAFAAVDVNIGGGGGGGVTELTNGQTVSGLAATSGNWLHYKIVVPSGATNLVATMSGGTGDADLYYRAGAQPTEATYDCRPYSSGNNEECTNASPAAGDHFIGIRAYNTFSGASLTVSYDDPTANVPPTAGFTSSVTDLTAAFTDTSTDSDGSIQSWSWNFGDGNSSTSANPSHTYAAAGTYTVTLTVTDNDGATDSTSASVTVTDPPPGDDIITNGEVISGLAANSGEWIRYRIIVPAGASNLVISISGSSGDADLYTRFGAAPTTTTYDCRPYTAGSNESCTYSSPSAGEYHIGIRAYSSFSGLSLTASYNEPGSGGGFTETNLNASGGNWLHYTIDVPAGMSALDFDISGGSGDADIYIRFNAAPTTSSWDYRPYLNGNNEAVNLTNPSAGTWYIGIRAYTTFSGVTLNAYYNP